MAAGLFGSAALFFAAGFTDDNVALALRLTARVAFVIFLLAFVARTAHQVFVTHFTSKLLRRRRLLGIAFAGMHTAHLLLIFYRLRVNDDFAMSVTENGPGAFIYLVILALFATSFDATARMLGSTWWKRLHTVGIWLIFIAFTQREIPRSLESAELANWTLVGLALLALLLRALPRWTRRDNRRSTA